MCNFAKTNCRCLSLVLCVFRQLMKILGHILLCCAKLAQKAELPAISMGMSGDYETAIAFGATHVRVGSAIFGARDYT
ncbi:hypothetical protein RT723_06525 [Psychrosphaera aquimarina]|uniref:Alanine racemase N-terminal domain-containing protein n=1 Tax=Psychrosphaera aquimarina TaxID=2044854 RepID=A0ABU3QYZ7_9GAMM|nr:hypothetical protein [Psychrosphaera aquimarina]MDU0112663.1 hypothetical protein [Psychrosphaera aquimarina]